MSVQAKQKITVKKCPVDGSELEAIQYETEIVDQCPKCAGTWCDEDELRKIIQSRHKIFSENEFIEIQAKESLAKPSKSGIQSDGKSCPICTQVLSQNNFSYSSGILIDRCDNGHGVWLDFRELEQLQVFSERWDNVSLELNSKYRHALQKAEKEGVLIYENAKKSGKENVLKHSRLRSFFKKLIK